MALLLASVAVPLPDEHFPGITFGARGELSKEDLAAIPFASRLDPELKGSDLGVAELATALHMPRTRYVEGEAIPVYFIVKNESHRARGLDMRLDLFGPCPIRVNSCSVHLRNCSDGTEVPFFRIGVWACGGPPPVVVPAHGYYCVRGDFSRSAGGPLPPGEYECSWDYARLRSNTVKFTVAPVDSRRKLGGAARAATTAFLVLQGQFHGRVPNFQLEKPSVVPRSVSSIAAALAVGVTGKYYPDLAHLPSQDSWIDLSAQLVPAGKPGQFDRLAITLSPRRKDPRLVLPTPVHLMMQVEALEEQAVPDWQAMAGESKQSETRREVTLDVPMTFSVELPAGWSKCLGFGGKTRVAVIVSSNRIEMPVARLETELIRAIRDVVTWKGLLRSAWQAIELPPCKQPPTTAE
jgi:hypothetical protein